jgi:hypothetical protein
VYEARHLNNGNSQHLKEEVEGRAEGRSKGESRGMKF